MIGLSLAWELASRCQPVVLLESASESLRSASWAGAGILPPTPVRNAVDPLEQLKALSGKLNELWADRLLSETGLDTGFRRSGGIYLARSPAETATLVANEYWWNLHGIQFARWSPDELQQREPGLAELALRQQIGAWFLPQEYQLRNPWHLRALKVASQKLGVEFHRETVTEIRPGSPGGPMVLTESGKSFSARSLCLCSGAWTRLLLERLGAPNGIMPVRGQIVLYRTSTSLLKHIVNEGHRYLVPRDDGRILAGSVEEEVGYDCQTTESALSSIRNWAESVVPSLGSATIEQSWAGLRPGSFDGLPYIGAVPGMDNVYAAAGHFRSGVQLASGTAVLLANEILGQANPIDLSPFRIGRG